MAKLIKCEQLIDVLKGEEVLSIRAWVENLGYVEVDKAHFRKVLSLYPYEVRFVFSTSNGGSIMYLKACESDQMIIK